MVKKLVEEEKRLNLFKGVILPKRNFPFSCENHVDSTFRYVIGSFDFFFCFA